MNDFVEGRKADSDESEAHVKPSRVDESVDVPVDTWVDVPHGMMAAPGTYVDDSGILRSEKDQSCVVWHHQCKAKHPRCGRKGIHPNEIVYDPDTNAPWCPTCYPKFKEHRDVEKLEEMFGSGEAEMFGIKG